MQRAPIPKKGLSASCAAASMADLWSFNGMKMQDSYNARQPRTSRVTGRLPWTDSIFSTTSIFEQQLWQLGAILPHLLKRLPTLTIINRNTTYIPPNPYPHPRTHVHPSPSTPLTPYPLHEPHTTHPQQPRSTGELPRLPPFPTPAPPQPHRATRRACAAGPCA
jgi:hypothetical protein